jgi:hypothetical protein
MKPREPSLRMTDLGWGGGEPIQGFLHGPFGFAQGSVEMTKGRGGAGESNGNSEYSGSFATLKDDECKGGVGFC